MRGERGFTLIEVVVAVAIAAILILGALWLFGAHPAAMRVAVDGFDQDYGAARALAAKTGNGATIVFAPRTTGHGYTMTVYSGRPKDAASIAAMQLDPVPVVVSDADISGPFGPPPFAVFLSSAGKPSGKSGYPTVSASGAVTFTVLASQPACPDTVNGIVFTFRGANGVTDTRKIGCDGIAMLSGTAAPQPTMTPEQLRIDTASMVAHWTGDSGPLHFKVGEFGYTHWFESGDLGVSDCGRTFASDSGSAPAQFAPSPYRTSSPSEMGAAPAPDANTPYTWATVENGHPPDQPPGDFALAPVAGNGGTCTVQIQDDRQQSVSTALQVMGDLDPRVSTMTFSSPTDAAQTLTLGKTFDNEQIQLTFGGACGGIVTETQTGNSVAGSISTTPTSATITVAPVAAGSCDLQVGDQYGEPVAIVHINVESPVAMATWPIGVRYGLNGTDLAMAGSAAPFDLATAVYRALDISAAVAGAPCPAIAYKDTQLSQADVGSHTFGLVTIVTDSQGCYDGSLVAYEPDGSSASYTIANNGCNPYLSSNIWSAQPAAASKLSMLAGATAVPSCDVTLQDGNGTGQGTSGKGLVVASIADNSCMTGCIVGPDNEGSTDCEVDPTTGGQLGSWETTTATFTAGAGLGTLVSDGNNWIFTRTGYGTVTIQLDDEKENDTLGGSPQTHDEHCVKHAPVQHITTVSY